MRYCIWLSLFLAILFHAGAQPVPIGAWQEHLPWNQLIGLSVSPSGMLCASPFGFYHFNASDKSILRYHKINGLHGSRLSAIEYQNATGKIIVAYTNADVDIVSGNAVRHISDIRIRPISADKTIRHIFSDGDRAYLSTGFGIVVLNTSKNEIADTWFPGSNGTPTRVNQLKIFDNRFYASTESGLLTTSINGSNPADFHNWSRQTNGLLDTAVTGVVVFQNNLFAVVGRNIFRMNGNSWEPWYSHPEVISVYQANEQHMAIAEHNGRIILLNSTAQIENTILLPAGSETTALLWHKGDWWVADLHLGLLRVSGSSVTETIVPDGPGDVVSGQIVADKSGVYCVPGIERKAGVFIFKDGRWTNITNFSSDVRNLNVIAATNGYIYAGSSGGGLVRIGTDNSITVLKENAGLSPALNSPGEYRVHGLSADRNGNLWMANDGADSALVLLKKDGSAVKFTIPLATVANSVSAMTTDNNAQLWTISPDGQGVICLSYGLTPDNPSDDQWRMFTGGRGRGNLPEGKINCIATDKFGFVWVGTDRGIGVMQCPSEALRSSCEFTLPIVQQDNFAGYLFQNESVQCIAVDGGNRKWIGTKNGVWLISASGDKVISRFTSDNSPLLSDDIRSIAVSPDDGVVYFATANGLCCYRGTATEAASSEFSVKIFPNPVPADFNGLIAIRDLPENAVVSITEADGRLVYRTRASGGQATWNGLDSRGRKPAKGVYLVLVSGENRRQNLAGKIVFLR